MNNTHKPRKFVTGANVGADSIPLECYREIGSIEIEGYMPKGFLRDDGKGEEVAKEHGLIETEGGYSTKDIKNAEMSDALLAFLVSKPMTGKGTMQTASMFIRGFYNKVDETRDSTYKIWVPIEKPDEPTKGLTFKTFYPPETALKPVLVIWDLSKENMELAAERVRLFLDKWKPETLMFSGPTLATQPDITELGVELMKKVYE